MVQKATPGVIQGKVYKSLNSPSPNSETLNRGPNTWTHGVSGVLRPTADRKAEGMALAKRRPVSGFGKSLRLRAECLGFQAGLWRLALEFAEAGRIGNSLPKVYY